MDGELTPWNKHGSHNSRVPFHIEGEHKEDNDLIGDSFAAREPMSSLSSCMSGAFKALLPDYHGTSPEMTTNSVKYSYSPNNHCLIKPGTAVDENIVERREKSDFLKDPLCEASASVTHMLPPRCSQYVPQEKDRDMDQGNCNWTSVIKDALEMSNGMEMEPTLSMDVCGPLMDFNAVYKGPETEAKITLRDHYQIAGSKVNEQDGQGVKAEPDSFISMLSDGLDKKKDVLEMGENDEPSILDVGSSLGKEELGMTGIRENEPEFLPGFNRSSYTPLSSSKGFMKSEKFPGIPSVKQSIEHTLQGTTQGPESCRDVSPSKTASTDICFKHATGNNKTVPEGSTLYGLHHLDLQKDCHLAEVTDGNTSVNYQDHPLPHHVQDKSINTSNLFVSETNTDNSESGLKMETDQTVVFNKIHLDYKCKDSQIEPGESGKINPSTVLLPCDEKVQNSEKNENLFINITSESSIPPPTENVHAALLSPTSRLDCSSQPNLQEALQKHKKSRKRRKSELEELLGPVLKSNKRDECSVCGSGISDSAVKPYLITNADANPPSPRRKLLCHSQLQMTQFELVNDIAETSQKPDHGCSENSQVKASSAARIDRKAVSRRKLKNRTKLCLKAKKSASCSNQFLSSTVLSSEEDCMSHFQVSDTTLVKEVGNPAIIQQAISGLESSIPECSPKKSTKKKALQTEKYALLTLQSKGDPPDDPTTFSEVEEDLIDFKRHQKTRRPGAKASKGKNKPATSLLSSQPILESVSQTDSVSTSVTESSNILSPQKSPKKSRQKKRQDINKGPKSPQDNFSLPLSKSKENVVISNRRTVKEKRSLKKATKTDDCDTTLLDIQPSTQKKTDSAPTSGTEVEPPVIFSTPRKSLKKKLSNIKPKALHIATVDQTAQSVLNPLSESDAGIVQPTTRRFSPRKTLNNFFSHSTVSENSETVQLNESISSDDSVSATVTEISGFSLKNTEKPSSKRRKTNINFMEAQTSNTSQKEDDTVLPLEDFASIVVSNTEKTVKVKRLSRNKTCDNRLNNHLVEDTSLLAFVTQENSISPLKTDSSSSFRQIKKPRKKTATKIKNEAEDLVPITLKPSANIVASSSQMTLKEKILVEKSITDEMKDNHATALFLMQTSTATLQHTECVSTPFAHSTQKKSKKMSDNKGEAVHTPAVDQSLQQESFDSPSTTEMDNSDSLNQKKINVKTKRQRKKVSKRKTHVAQAVGSIREQFFPVTVQQENSFSNRNTNCEEMTQKRTKKKTSPLKVQHFQPEDYAEHSSVSPALLPPPISLGKDATQDPCRKTDVVKESAESHVENRVVTTEDVACSQSLLKKAKKTRRKQLLVQKEVNEQSNILELAHKEDKKSDAPSVVQEAASENFEMLEADSCDQHLKVAKKKKGKKFKQIAEKHEFANVSLSQEKNTGSDEAGVMVTFTQIQDFCKLPDGQAVGSQQPEKDGDVVNQKDVIKEGSRIKDLKTTKNPKTKGRKAGRKKRKIAGLVTQTVKEEEHKDVSYDNRIACDFQNDAQIQISDGSQRTGVIPEEPVMKSRKSFVENVSTQGSLDITACHTRLDETLYSSMQPADIENQYTVEEKSPRRGRPPSNKNKKPKLSFAHLEDNASSSVQISDLTSCQDSTEIPSSSMQPTDCEVQYTVKQKSPRRRRPPSIKSKKQKLPITHLEDETPPSVQISDLSSCQDSTETLSNSIQPADCEGQYTKQKSPRRGRPPSNKNKKPKLSLAHLEDNTSPSVQISDHSSCQDSTETLSSSMQTADCEDQYTVKQKSPRRGRPPSNKNKKPKLSLAHLEDNASPSVQISDLSSCQDSTENTVQAAASPAKQKVVQPLKKRKVVKVDNVMVTSQLGTDPSESLQRVTDDLSHNIPALKHKKGKNLKRLKLSSLMVSSRTSEPSVKGFQKTDPIHSLPQNSTNDFNEKGQTSLPMPGTVEKQDDVLADIKIENKATIKAVKGGKRGRKRQIKEPHHDLVTEHEELQRLTTKAKNNKRQDCSEPAKSFLTKFSITNESSTEDQSIVSSEKNNEKTKLSSVEMVPAISVGTFQIPKTEVLCSSSTQLSSNLMKDDKKYKEHDAEPNGKDLFAVIDNAGLSGEVSSGICNLISSNVVKKESEDTFLDTKIKPNTELKCTQETDGLGVKMSGETIIDNSSEIGNAFQTSTEQKVNVFTQDGEECVVMPSKGSNKRRIRSKPKEIMKKPLTCKYCGVSFRHITAYAIHQRIHTGDKPYKCKICGKSFAHLSKLKSHRNVHKQDTSFPCPCCSQKFFQKEDLLGHFQVHLQESRANDKPQNAIKSKKNTLCSETPNNYGCIICKKNFVNHVELQNHMQAHEVEKPLTCKDCGKKFWKASSLAAHGKSHWPVKPYACSVCGKGFTRLKALQKHSQDHAGETPFSCFHCGHAFSALSELRMHQASKTCIARKNDEASGNIEGFIVSQGVDGQVNTPVFFKCQICKQLFRKWCQYTLHLQTHTSSPPYICFSCGQCYEKDSEMNVHCEVCCQSSGEEQICGASLSEQMQSVTQVYPLKCTSSQTLPSTGIQLNSQTQTSSEQLPRLPQSMDVVPTQTRDAELSQLPKTCSTQSPIQLPVAQSPNHSDVGCSSTSSSVECIEITPSLRKFKCSRCGQRFEQYRTLSAHLQMHAPGFRYTCAHCGQFFERWSKLWLHQRRHRLKSHRYSCNQCNLQFHFFSSFKEHMINHAGQRPYACPLCPKTFIQETSLHAHQCESHKLYKSLKCDVCCKTFSSLTNLIKHSLLHNGSTSHICLPCNLPFTNTRVLKEHLKTHTTHHRPALPDIPSEPLDFPHKCKRCKASFSTGDLLYAHQIRHSRDPTTLVRPALVPTSKLSDSCCNDTSTPSTTRRNPISNLKLDGIPNDESLYVYSHPDRLYMPPSRRAQIPVINLDPDANEEVSDSQNISPEPPNREITAQSDSTHLPQATSGEETSNLKETASGICNYSHRYRRSRFVETSVDMELETTVQEESESFECADCTEKLSSVLSLYEHYILHALGDTYVH